MMKAGRPATMFTSEHPCNSCGGVDLPIVTDSGYCTECLAEVETSLNNAFAEGRMTYEAYNAEFLAAHEWSGAK